jgi:hypothetical protein
MVPLTARGVTLGVAGLGRAEQPGAYDEADVRLVSDLAARAAVHIDNARLYTREHDAAVTLQRSMLPRDIPQAAGLDIAYRYQPASQAAEIGGDWFDVIPLEADRDLRHRRDVFDPCGRDCSYEGTEFRDPRPARAATPAR